MGGEFHNKREIWYIGYCKNSTREEEVIMACFIYGSLDDSMRGPFPHKAGEFCGNALRKDVAVFGDGNAVVMSPAALSFSYLPFDNRDIKLKIGKPAEIDGRYSSQEWEKFGYVGLYFAEDLPLGEDMAEIDTDIFLEEVVSGERLPEKPVDLSKIRRRELSAIEIDDE